MSGVNDPRNRNVSDLSYLDLWKLVYNCWSIVWKECCWPKAADMSLHFRIVEFTVAMSTGFAPIIGEFSPGRDYGRIHTKVIIWSGVMLAPFGMLEVWGDTRRALEQDLCPSYIILTSDVHFFSLFMKFCFTQSSHKAAVILTCVHHSNMCCCWPTVCWLFLKYHAINKDILTTMTVNRK